MDSITISAPMTGRVIEVLVSDGDAVSSGDLLVVVESMKMENEIISQHTGRVSHVHVTIAQTLSEGDVMLEIEVGP